MFRPLEYDFFLCSSGFYTIFMFYLFDFRNDADMSKLILLFRPGTLFGFLLIEVSLEQNSDEFED